jgi:hypothetical protein
MRFQYMNSERESPTVSFTVPANGQASATTPDNASRRGGALQGRLAALLILIAAGLYLWPIAGFTRDYDEGVYWQSLRAMAEGHPLFTSVFSSQPPMFLLSIYPFYMAFGQTIAAARIGIAIFALIGIVAMYWLASEIGGPWAGLIAAALLIVDPHYLHQAQTLQAEGPAVAIEILAVALAVAASRRAGRWRMTLAALAGVAVAFGTLIKLLDVVALVPIALYLGAPLLRAFDGGNGRLRKPTETGLRVGLRASARDLGLVAAGGIVATVIALAPFFGVFGALWDQVVTFHLAAAHTEKWNLTGNFRTILGGFGWLGIPAALAVGVAWWRRDWRMGPPLLWLLASVLILERQVPLFDHHTVIIGPCLALMVALTPALLGPAVNQVAGRWLGLAVMVVALLVFVSAAYKGLRTTRGAAQGPNDAAQAQIAAIQSFTTPGEVIVTDDQYTAAAAGHSVPPELVDTSYVRASSGYLTAAQLESIITRDNIRVIILDTGRLSSVKGFDTWLHAHYQKLVDLGHGGALYVRLAPGQVVA